MHSAKDGCSRQSSQPGRGTPAFSWSVLQRSVETPPKDSNTRRRPIHGPVRNRLHIHQPRGTQDREEKLDVLHAAIRLPPARHPNTPLRPRLLQHGRNPIPIRMLRLIRRDQTEPRTGTANP